MTYSQRRTPGHSVNEARSNLLLAAAAIISESGAGAATSRAIAEQAGENLAAITYYFGSKKRLLAEAHAHVARRLIQPVVETLTSERPPIERMLAATLQLNQILEGNRADLVGYTQALAAAAHDHESGQSLRSLHRELRAVLSEDIRAQQAGSHLPDWVEPEAMANLIIALVNGVAVTSATSNSDDFDAVRVAKQFTSLLAGSTTRPR